MRRPFALPPGITPAQARAAAVTLCDRAVSRDEATALLRCAGRSHGPDARGTIQPAQRKARAREAAK